MKTIWKYAITITHRFDLYMPWGAQVLTVQTQGGLPQMWCVVEPGAPQEKRSFEVRGTGEPLGDVGDYIRQRVDGRSRAELIARGIASKGRTVISLDRVPQPHKETR